MPHGSKAILLIAALLTPHPVFAQSNDELLKQYARLNNICRDYAGSAEEAGDACEKRDRMGQDLKVRNICFGELGRVEQCHAEPDPGAPPSAPQAGQAPSESACRRFAENEIIEVKGFLVEFDYAAEETEPTKVKAVVLDKPICADKEQETVLKTVVLNIQSSTLLGRHCRIEMQMLAGETWSGVVQSIFEDKGSIE